MPPLLRRLAPLIFLVLWSCGFVFVKLGLRDADPLTFLALRFTVVVTVLGLAFAALRPPLPATGSGWLHLAVVGLFMQAAYLTGSYMGMKAGLSAGAMALITSQQPILIGLLAPRLAGERVGVGRWSGLLLGVGGACWVIVADTGGAVGSLSGLPWALLSLLAMTAGTLWERRFGAPVHPVGGTLVQCALALLIAAPLAWSTEAMQVHWTASLVASLAYLVIGNSLIAVSLLLAMIREGEASRVSALFFLVPPVAAVIAWVVLGEAIAALAWPGMVLAALGIWLVMRSPGVKSA